MNGDTLARVHYFERQFLRTQDFADEQAYHIAARRRHLIAHHRWGIVVGLELVAQEGTLYLQPGMAVDGYGRELIVPVRRTLRARAFVEKGRDVLDVWLVYGRSGSDRAPRGYAGCAEPAAEQDGGALPSYRWVEQAQVRLEAPSDPGERRRPGDVPAGDRGFPPMRPSPDDPAAAWPVFLGQVQWNRASDDQPYSVDLTGRPYAELVGEAITAPSGRARVQVGNERPAENRRFAVFVPAPDPTAVAGAPSPAPRLEIGLDGRVDVRGTTTVAGDLLIAGGAVEFGVGPAPQVAVPWSIYHVPNGAQSEELRIEMAQRPAGGGRNEVVIGSWDAEAKQFRPCLSVADDCTVTIFGNLVIKGQLIEQGPARVRGTLVPEAQAMVTATLLNAVGGTAALPPQALRFGSTGALQPPPATIVTPPVADLDTVAAELAADEQRLAEFVQRVRQRPELAAKLSEGLR
jgi:hypothetical protein